MSLNNPPPPPVINKKPPETIRQQILRTQKPSQSAWLATFKRIIQTPNTRYAFLWLTGGLLFCLYGKRAIQRRQDDLMIEDINNYLENKRKKDF